MAIKKKKFLIRSEKKKREIRRKRVGSANFFCEVPDGKYFQPHEPRVLSNNHSALSLQYNSNQRQSVNKCRRLFSNKILFSDKSVSQMSPTVNSLWTPATEKQWKHLVFVPIVRVSTQ